MKRILPFCLLLLCTLLRAQDPNYILIDKSKGLPSNSVYYVFQDSRGFIWVATDEGLSRYDGYRFRTFTHRSQTSRPGSEIREDRFGRIWYENFDGYLYYVQNDTMHALKQRKPAGYYVYGITPRSLYISQEKGVDVYDLESLQLRKTIPFRFTFVNFTQLSGDAFYVSFDSLAIIKDDGSVVVNAHPPDQVRANAFDMVPLPRGNMWMYTKSTGTKACYRKTGNSFSEFFRIDHEKFIHTTAFTDGKVWFCTPSGTFAYDENGQPSENGLVLFPGKSISCVMKDRENNFWFSTTNEGLLFVADISSRNYFSEFRPTKLSIIDQALWFGTQTDEIWKTDFRELKPELVRKGVSNHSVDYLEPGDRLSPVLIASDWFTVMDRKGRQLRSKVSTKDCQVIDTGIYACALTGYCGLFFAHDAPDSPWKQLGWAPKRSLGSDPVYQGVDLVHGVRGKSVAWDDRRKTIYFATNKGLYASTLQGTKEIRQNDSTLYFSSIACYDDRLYGLSTQGDLFVKKLDSNDAGTWKSGLPQGELRNMKLCPPFLFLGSSSGMFALNLSGEEDSIVHIPTYAREVSDVAYRDSMLYMATADGIFFHRIMRQQERQPVPLFVPSYFSANNTALPPGKNLQLEHGQNDIEIGYSILSFGTGFNYPLYYSINDNDWELCPPDARSLKLVSLAPGEYNVRFRLGDEKENRAVAASFSFSIGKPWWKKTWALLLYAFAAIGVLYLLYRRQLGIQEKKNRQLREKIELEKNLNRSILASIRSQMNPHFFYNALNTIQSFIYANDKQMAGTYLTKFSKLTRMILEMSDKEMVSLHEEITACRLYLELEQARFGDDFVFSIDAGGIADHEQLRLPSMIIQPYIENAVKHGLLHKKGTKKLHIVFEKQEANLVVSIDDNGIGRQRSQEINAIRKDKHRSFSGTANQKRLEVLNSGRQAQLAVEYTDKKDENGQPAGTRVVIQIPI